MFGEYVPDTHRFGGCKCPSVWHGIFPPPCPVHNPPYWVYPQPWHQPVSGHITITTDTTEPSGLPPEEFVQKINDRLDKKFGKPVEALRPDEV